MMRETFEKNCKRWLPKLHGYARAQFRGILEEMPDVISNVLEKTWRNIDEIEVRYLQWSAKKDGIKPGRAAFLYSFMRLEVRRQGIDVVNEPRKRRTNRLNESGEFDEDVTSWRPTAVCQPEQEHVVFNKQLIAMCGILPSDEASVMALILDRATAEEIVEELGVSRMELLRRRANGMRRLAEKVGLTS